MRKFLGIVIGLLFLSVFVLSITAPAHTEEYYPSEETETLSKVEEKSLMESLGLSEHWQLSGAKYLSNTRGISLEEASKLVKTLKGGSKQVNLNSGEGMVILSEGGTKDWGWASPTQNLIYPYVWSNYGYWQWDEEDPPSGAIVTNLKVDWNTTYSGPNLKVGFSGYYIQSKKNTWVSWYNGWPANYQWYTRSRIDYYWWPPYTHYINLHLWVEWLLL